MNQPLDPNTELPKIPDEPLLEGAEPNELEAKLAACEKKAEEYLAGWQRAKADFSNYKRDEAIRLQEIAQYGSFKLLEELIRVVDSFDLGIAALEKQGSIDKGIYMIRVQFEDMLRRHGIQRIPITPGDQLDLSKHEVIGELESEHPPGSIAQEIEAGYMLHDRVLRPVRVMTSKGKN